MRDNEGKDTDIFGFVSGEPVEFNIVQIGKAFMFDLKNTEKKASNEGVGANLLSDFQFRTLPVSDDSWKYILSQTETNFNNVKNLMEGIGQKNYNETKMLLYNKDTTLENLQELGCDGAENINLADFAQRHWQYSSSKNLNCSTVLPNGAGSCNFGEQSKCDFLTRSSPFSFVPCLTGFQQRWACQFMTVENKDGSICAPDNGYGKGLCNSDDTDTNLLNLIKHGRYYDPDIQRDVYTTGMNLQDFVHIWTQTSCDLQSSCGAKSYQIPKGTDCDKVFEPPEGESYNCVGDGGVGPEGTISYDCPTAKDSEGIPPQNPVFLKGTGMQCLTGNFYGEYKDGYPEWSTYVDDENQCFKILEENKVELADFLYLDNRGNIFEDEYGIDDTEDNVKKLISDESYKRMSAWARARQNFNCVGQPYTNDQPVYPTSPFPFQCQPQPGSTKLFCDNTGIITPQSTIKSKILGHASGCPGRFADTGTYGPIVGRVDKASFLKFVSMDNLLKKWSNFSIMLAPPSYCHPDSDELAMIHLLAKYGEFETSGSQSLMTFMGAPYSGAAKGYYDITSNIYGASCDYPFMKVMPGSNITMDKCCVHAYTNNITCSTDLRNKISDSVPGISTTKDPSRSNDVTLLPWQELSCPLEVTIDDERSPGMSLKQQFGSISVSASKLVADQTGTMNALGRGCYMCVTPSVNNSLFETFNTKTNWLDHYDPVKCNTQSIIPTMEFVPKSNSGTNGHFDKVEIDPTKRFRPSRQYPTARDEIAGVYTLYPYINIPAQLPEDQINDTIIQNNYQKLLSLQLKYYYDVDYHIKVEVTGTFA